MSFGLGAIGPLLPEFLTNYPGVVLDLRLEDRIVDLMPEGVDVAIRVGWPPPITHDVIATELVRLRSRGRVSRCCRIGSFVTP